MQNADFMDLCNAMRRRTRLLYSDLDLNEEVLIQGVAMEDGGGQSLNITILILRTNKSRPVWWHSMKHAHRFTLPD
jgi:hypothetical protein